MTFCGVSDVQPSLSLRQAFYAADTDQPPMSRLNNLGAARSSLVRPPSFVGCTQALALSLTRPPSPPQLKCVELQKGSGYEDSMIATYVHPCP